MKSYKNMQLICLLITLFILACQYEKFDPFIPSDKDLILYLPFSGNLRNEVNGSLPIAIQSVVSFSGAISNAASYKFTSDRLGQSSSALLLEGKSHLEYPFYSNQTAFDSVYYSDFTIAAWIKIDSIESNLFQSAFISTIASANNDNLGIASLEIDEIKTINSLRHYITFRFNVPGGFQQIPSFDLDSNVFFNKFHHICVTKENDLLTLFIDGKNVRERRGVTKFTNRAQVAPFSFKVGRFFIGALDEVRIYSRTLSSEEVKLLYNM